MVLRGQPPSSSLSRGFTLLELLLVLCLIALTSSAVLPTLLPAGDVQLKPAASKLRLQLQRLHERALERGINYGVRLGTSEYSFVVYTDSGWQPVTDDRYLQPVVFPHSVTLSFTPGDSVWAASLEREAALYSRKPENKSQLPTIRIWASGEMTPGSIRLSKGQSSRTITVDEHGGMQL